MLTLVDEIVRAQSSSACLVAQGVRTSCTHGQEGGGPFRPVVLLKEQIRFPRNTPGSLPFTLFSLDGWHDVRTTVFQGSATCFLVSYRLSSPLAYPGASGPARLKSSAPHQSSFKSDWCPRLGCVQFPGSPGLSVARRGA